MTPIVWVAVGGVLATALAFGGGVAVGMGLGEDKEYAKRAREDSIVEKATVAFDKAAGEHIAKIKPRNVTIRQETEREIKTNTVYADCRVPPAGVRLANEAITGAPGAEPAGGRVVPKADAVDYTLKRGSGNGNLAQ